MTYENFDYKNVAFTIYKPFTKEKTIELFKEFLQYIRKGDIYYIELLEEDEGYIYINKEGPYEYFDEKTIQMIDLLRRLGFDASESCEDYGYIDVIVLNNLL